MSYQKLSLALNTGEGDHSTALGVRGRVHTVRHWAKIRDWHLVSGASSVVICLLCGVFVHVYV